MKWLLRTGICLWLVCCLACGEEAECGAEAPVARREVTVLFALGGLGDMGYNDLLLRGVYQVMEWEGVSVLYRSPESVEEAEAIFTDWLRHPAESGVPSLFVLAASDYEQMAARCLSVEGVDLEGKDILLFESRNPEGLPVGSFSISMFGASFLGGVTAGEIGAPALAVLAMPGEGQIAGAADGFAEGYRQVAKDEAEVVYLADDWSGFAAADKAYASMEEWCQRYSFIFPVAGGSNVGIYRYVREFPRGLFTAGMDVDQSPVCSGVTGSVVKRMDSLFTVCITDWIEGRGLPEGAVYGLESGYVDWVVAPDFQEAFGEAVAGMRDEALKQERRYHETMD